MPRPIPIKAYKHLDFPHISTQNGACVSGELCEEGHKNSAFNLLDRSRLHSCLSWIDPSNQEKCSQLEVQSDFQNSQGRTQNQLSNESILSVSKFITTQKNEFAQTLIKEKDSNLHPVGFNQVEMPNCTQKSTSGDELKKSTIKQRELKKSNAIKNFANNFVKEMKNSTIFDTLKQKYEIDKKSFKNIMDNLNKKIVYEKRCQKMEDVISMVNHANKNYSLFLIDSCEEFIGMYPQIVRKSEKLTDKRTNLLIIQKLQQRILKQKQLKML